jgi:trans-aconitate methyltransferase
MPYSSGQGKMWLLTRIRDLQPRSILDIGAGSGTYWDLLGSYLPACRFTAVEVHEPYVAQFRLREKYNEVIIGDARSVELPEADVVILGDVLEHMRFGEAKALWTRCRQAAQTAVFLSLPIVEWPQGPVDGNEHEAHVHHWSYDAVIAHLEGIRDSHAYQAIGVFQAGPLAQDDAL